MNNNKLTPFISGTSGKNLYEAPICFELQDKTLSFDIEGKGKCELRVDSDKLVFSGLSHDFKCVKCEDKVYLLNFDGSAILVNTADGTAILSENHRDLYKSGTLPEYKDELCGDWLDISLSPGSRVRMDFSENKVKFDNTEFDAKYAKLSDSIYAVTIAAEDVCTMFVVDTARFLLYVSADNGSVFSGHAHLM